ncbi:MAG: energy-coupling factor transporter transmembrane protein EcfT [Clostridium sp.]|nr:energy-coupling factor transporter transmembrane protein EcfT [Clostridium sp.]MCM1209432.1 energy-coupling factor transporter transmembrane protein EcfT [Ruminococcus sp.]
MKFENYHPGINFIYFLFSMTFILWFNHPVYVVIAFLSSFAYSIKLNGKREVIFNFILILFVVIYCLWYSYYNHFGITNIRKNFIGNNITAEALFYGLVRGMTIAAFIMNFACLLAVFSTDKVIYLAGRLFPRLSLFISIFLRSFSRIRERNAAVTMSRKGIGMGKGQGTIIGGIRNRLRILSIVITWTLEDYMESSMSMKCRGYTLKHRTSFSIYRFDNRDRSLVIMLFIGITLTLMAVMLNQTTILYDPEIIMYRPKGWSYLFYLSYACFLLLPMGIEIVNAIKYEKMHREEDAYAKLL